MAIANSIAFPFFFPDPRSVPLVQLSSVGAQDCLNSLPSAAYGVVD